MNSKKQKKPTKLWKCAECTAILEEVVDCVKGPICVPHCCGAPMEEVHAKMVDGAKEKHLPVWKKDGCITKVQVGSIPHPMTEEHHIEWIEVISPCGCRVCRKYLKHDEPAEADFCMDLKPGSIIREYCNLHGLWVAEVQ